MFEDPADSKLFTSDVHKLLSVYLLVFANVVNELPEHY